MADIETRLQELGLELPGPPKLPPHVRLPFSLVRVVGNRAVIAGHSAQNLDGSVAEPFGKVGA